LISRTLGSTSNNRLDLENAGLDLDSGLDLDNRLDLVNAGLNLDSSLDLDKPP
jgi:hypothetical protein